VLAFYDTETTGLGENFTQILQIGWLFTDGDLNIRSSKKSNCRNSPWELPSPEALLTTGFTPHDLKTSKNSNFEMMQEVNGWLRSHRKPLIFIGYNSLGFDEPVMAQNFYQNLLPPGLTTSKISANGQSNGRADVMRMVQMALLYMPGALKLDILNYYGTPSMTLKNVARQNGVALPDSDAHDALNDIRATVGVARVIQKTAPQIWDQSIKLATLDGVNKFLDDHDIFTFASFMYGKPRVSSVMTSLAENEGDSTTQALFDLRTDPARYMTMTVDELKNVFLSNNDNPFVMVRKDEQPVLMPMELSDPVLKPEDDIALYKKRAEAIKTDKAFLANVAKAALLASQEQLAAAPALSEPETMINKEVPAPVQAKLDAWAKEFREAETWHDRAVLANGFSARFKDELAADPTLQRYEEFATRLVFENAKDELTAAQQLDMNKFIAARILNDDFRVPYMTIAKARAELEKIEKYRTDPRWKDVTTDEIATLKKYYTSLETLYAPYVPSYDIKEHRKEHRSVKPRDAALCCC